MVLRGPGGWGEQIPDQHEATKSIAFPNLTDYKRVEEPDRHDGSRMLDSARSHSRPPQASGVALMTPVRIIVIVIVYALALGVVLGTYGDRLGLSGGLRGVIIAVSVVFLAAMLRRRSQGRPRR